MDNLTGSMKDVAFATSPREFDLSYSTTLEEIMENAYAKAFIVQINQGEPMPTVSEMGQLWSIHVNNIRSMWSGEQTPEEAAKNMVAQLEEAVELMNSGK